MPALTPAVRLHPGDIAPDVAVSGPDGPVQLSALWAVQPLVLTFLRHYG